MDTMLVHLLTYNSLANMRPKPTFSSAMFCPVWAFLALRLVSYVYQKKGIVKRHMEALVLP